MVFGGYCLQETFRKRESGKALIGSTESAVKEIGRIALPALQWGPIAQSVRAADS
jgi:hypothetical protein